MTNSTAWEGQEPIELTLCSGEINVDESEWTSLIFNPYFFIPVNAILSFFALSGNILILFALQKDSTLHPPSKLLLRCLSSTDLCVGLISQPIFVIYLMAAAYRNWEICGITEGLAYMVSTVLCGESIFTLTVISADRLLALMLKLRYRHVVTLRRVRSSVIVSWIISFAFSLTYLWDKRRFFLGCCAWILVCLIISTCCYTKIYFTLRHHQAQIQDHLQAENSGATGICMARYKKTVSSALCVYLALLVCYLPFTVATAISALSGLSPTNAAVLNFGGFFVFFNLSLNPVLYYWKIKEVRQAVKETIRNIFAAHNG